MANTATIDFLAMQATTLTGGTGSNLVFMNDGNDFYTSAGTDEVVVGPGNNTINAATGSVLAFGGAGTMDFIGGATASSTIIGAAGGLNVSGNTGRIVAYGGSGANSITGGTGGFDTLVGGTGTSYVKAYASSDLVVGGTGTAYLTALASNGTVIGGSGPDQINTGGANITVVGGAGAATVDAGITTTDFIGTGAEVINFAGGITSTGSGAFDVVVGYRPGTDVINFDKGTASTTGLIITSTTPIEGPPWIGWRDKIADPLGDHFAACSAGPDFGGNVCLYPVVEGILAGRDLTATRTEQR